MAVERILHLLASLAALTGTAPSFYYLDLAVQAVFILTLLGGFFADRQGRVPLPSLPATLLSLLFSVYYLVQMTSTHIVEPLVNLLVVLLAVRLMTEKSGRNLLQIFVLSTFVLASSSLLTLGAGYLLALIVLVGLIAFGLLLTGFYVTEPGLRLKRRQWLSLLRTGAILPLGSLLLMLFFFVLLPRTQHPLWHFLNPGANPAAGFSEEVKPGTQANLVSSGVPAFRAEMPPIDPQDLYWRGLVLNQTDGKSWSRDKNPPADLFVRDQSPSLNQIIMSEPRANRYLPGLDLPGEAGRIASQRSSDAVNEARRNLDRTVQYTLRSFPNRPLHIKQPSAADFYLRAPAAISSRLQTVVDDIRERQDRRAKIAAIEQFFIRQQLSYATRDLPRNDTPVETFLFDSKRGYCEYFASSFAMLLRWSGVPARLVGGYLGGRYNEMGGYYLIDEDMAHVWVEALNDENRWTRIDPSRLAINAGEAVAGLARRPFNWSQSALDYLDTAWSRLVITYDLRKQFTLANTVGKNLRQLRPSLPRWYGWWLLPPLLLATGFFAWRTRGIFRLEPRERLLKAYLKQVKKSASLTHLPDHIGLYELARRSDEPLCRAFCRIYGAAIYTGQALTSAEENHLRNIIKQLKGKSLSLDVDDTAVGGHRNRGFSLAIDDEAAYTPKHLD